MQKKAFIIHGWDGSPKDCWIPWLKRELEKDNFEVYTPQMPETSTPIISTWVNFLSQIAVDIDEDTCFIGHSIGCQTIMRFLEILPKDKKIGDVVFVAGWFTLMNLETEEEKLIAKPWLETPINFKKIKDHTDRITAIFSDNDPVVPLENTKLFSEKLGAKIILKENRGHFTQEDAVEKIPEIIAVIQKRLS